MHCLSSIPRYNQRIRQMFARASSGLRLPFPHSAFFALLRLAAVLFSFSSLLFASNLTDAARQLAGRIAAVAGPGAIALDLTNHSSLNESSVAEIRTALEGQLRAQGIRTAAPEQSMGTVTVVLSENIRDYVWTAEISIGTDPSRVVLVSLPRPPTLTPLRPSFPIKMEKTFLFAQPQPILDAVLIDAGEAPFPNAMASANNRLLILDADHVAIYHQQPGHWGMPGGPGVPGMRLWELEASLPIAHTRPFPRDNRGRLFLRRDHLFDAYLPGLFCRSNATAPLRLDCNTSDDPWPLTGDETGPNAIRAFYAPARNFFTGALSPAIGKISNAPSFYSAVALPRANYTLWVLTATDGSVHLIDGITDQALRSGRAGSDIAGVAANCGVGPQLLVTDSGDPARDTIRAFQIPDRDPVAVSSDLEFDGRITALWSDALRFSAVAIVKREDRSEDQGKDAGQYEAYRISITCVN